MQISYMKEALYLAYPGEGWKKKVDKMPDNQIRAVYYRFLKEGKFYWDKKGG